MCNCIEETNKLLEPTGNKLSLAVFFGGHPTTPIIATEPISKGTKRQKATLTPTFCPFCGTKYVQEKKS